MPGLIRGVARTAVIAGTASAVGGRVNHRQQEKWASQDQQAYAEQQQQAPVAAAPVPVAPAAPAAPVDDTYEQLKKYGALHEQGILTDDEFAAQKAKILNA